MILNEYIIEKVFEEVQLEWEFRNNIFILNNLTSCDFVS